MFCCFGVYSSILHLVYLVPYCIATLIILPHDQNTNMNPFFETATDDGIEPQSTKKRRIEAPQIDEFFIDNVSVMYDVETGPLAFKEIADIIRPLNQSIYDLNMSVVRADYDQIIVSGLVLEWKVMTKGDPASLHYCGLFIAENTTTFEYFVRANLHPLFSEPQMIMHSLIEIQNPRTLQTFAVKIKLTIKLCDPQISGIELTLTDNNNESVYSLPSMMIQQPFRSPARPLNLIIPIPTRISRCALSNDPDQIIILSNIFRFRVRTEIDLSSRHNLMYVAVAALYQNGTLGDWQYPTDEYVQFSGLKHELHCNIKLLRWAYHDSVDQIGWRFTIKSIYDQPGFICNIEFIRRDYLKKSRDVSSFVDLWFNRNNDWFNVDRPMFWMHESAQPRPKLDGIVVDRSKLTADKIMEYLHSIRTEQGRIYSIFNDYQFPFQFEMLRFKNEDGLDFGAVTQEFFQLTFTALSDKLSHGFDVNTARALFRMWVVCLKMKSWNIARRPHRTFIIQCSMPASYFNPKYFEIALGRLDQLVHASDFNPRDLVSYLRRLQRESIINDWVPGFAKQYLENDDTDLEPVSIMLSICTVRILLRINDDRLILCSMEAIGVHTAPKTLRQKAVLIQQYIYKAELKGFVDLIRRDFLYLGISIYGGSSYLSINFEQFRSMFYIKAPALLEDGNVNKLKALIFKRSTWRDEPSAWFNVTKRIDPTIMQQHFLAVIDKNVRRKNAKWLENLIQFWTSKCNVIPDHLAITILTNYSGRPRPMASACFHHLILPRYLEEDGAIFETMLNEAISGLKNGFTSFR